MALALDFDFEAFAVEVIKTIDEIRSIGSNPKNKGVIEHRINAFYRAIGLPAVAHFDSEEGKRFKDERRIKNNGNTFATFDSENELDYSDFDSGLSKRRQALNRNIDSKEIKDLLHNVSAKPSEALSVRKSGAMLPLVIDGHMYVGPDKNRIATAFASENDIQYGDVRLKRPLIESVIYTRLKGSGATDSGDKQAIVDQFIKSIDPKGKLGIDTDTISADNDVGINLLVANSFRKALISATEKVREAIVEANKAVTMVGENYTYENGNIAEQNPSKSTEDPAVEGATDKQKNAIAKKEAKNQSVLTLLEYSTSDSDVKNATDNILFSNVLSALAPTEKKIKEDKKAVNETENKNLERVKTSVKTFDLFSGQFSGISAVDILIVLSALYEIPLNNVIGLLNKESKQNLSSKGMMFASAVANADGVGVRESLSVLEASVTNIYRWVDTVLSHTRYSDKESIKSGGRG